MGSPNSDSQPPTHHTMKFLCLFALVAAASARNLKPKLDDLEYGFCAGSPTPATLTAAVDPFPVVISTGETITLSVSIDLAETVPVGTQVSLKIKREGIIDIPFPCLEIDGLHIGSCDYDGDYLLNTDSATDTLCPNYFPEGQACNLPLNPGMYGGDPPIVIEVPEIPDIIGGLLGSGTYYAEATLTTGGSTFACIYIRVELDH